MAEYHTLEYYVMEHDRVEHYIVVYDTWKVKRTR